MFDISKTIAHMDAVLEAMPDYGSMSDIEKRINEQSMELHERGVIAKYVIASVPVVMRMEKFSASVNDYNELIGIKTEYFRPDKERIHVFINCFGDYLAVKPVNITDCELIFVG